MGLDMYIFRMKTVNQKDAEWLNEKTQSEIEARGYSVFPAEDVESFNSILPYGRKIKASCEYVNMNKIKEDNGLSEKARVVGVSVLSTGVSYSFIDGIRNDVKKIRLPKDVYETVKDRIEWAVDTRQQFDIPAGYAFLRKRPYRDNMILTFVHESEKTVSLTDEQYKSYIYSQFDDVWVFEKEEVGYWRKAYDLEDMIYDFFNGKIENCGYYVMPKDLMKKINQYQEAHNYDKRFYELPDDECYVYHEWY